MTYWTLCQKIDGAYYPQFGDYDRATVTQEREDMIDHGTPRRDLEIISTNDGRADVEAGIALLNSPRA